MTAREELFCLESSALSCFLLGDEPLLIRCAEFLRGRGHSIVGIVSGDRDIVGWARDNTINVIDRTRYHEFLRDHPVDVLLSIGHYFIIDTESLANVRVVAANYHDGPLPRYSGMNCSAWALLNRESKHAVVWHRLTARLDDGDILAQRELEIEAGETSVSLNMRNAVLALDAFRELMLRLEARDVSGTAQRDDIERMTFSRLDRPPALSTIDLTWSMSEINALVRACEFGNYVNRFGAAKIMNGECAVIVHEAVPCTSGEEHRSHAPGRLCALDEDTMHVACGDGCVRFSSFTTQTGQVISATAAARELQLAVDKIAVAPTRLRHACDMTISWTIARAEPHFIRALACRELPLLPFATPTAVERASIAVSLPEAFTQCFASRRIDAIAALYVFTLSSLLRRDEFDVAYADDELRADKKLLPLRALLFPSIPLPVRIDAEQDFAAYLDEFSGQRALTAEHPVFLLDLVARHPELRAQDDLGARSLAPIALQIGSRMDKQNGRQNDIYSDSPAANQNCDTSIKPDNTDGTNAFERLLPGAQIALVFADASAQECRLCSAGQVSATTLEMIAKAMATVAAKVVAQAGQPLKRIDLLDAAMYRTQIFDWNATTRPFPDGLRIHELFEAQVARQPDALALLCGNATMTFRELEHCANRIANTLQERGIGVGKYVAVMVDRSFDLVATLIGITKSGAAYLPIEPGTPQDRIRFMLEDANCRIAVATAQFAGFFANNVVNVIPIGGAELRCAATSRPRCPATASDVCYTIYTSGSTGTPKGVVLSHRAVANTLDWANRTLGVSPADRLLFVNSPGFDLSVYDIFGALGAGASVCIVPTSILQEPADLARCLIDSGATIWDSTPPAFTRLLPFLQRHAMASPLRLVMLSGDWIPVSLPDKIAAIFPRAKVMSLGGATEAAIWSNYYPIEKVDPAWKSIPYGVPIQNARYYILDNHLRPLPPMISGDLYIAGTCLAEGYLNRPELTAERFVADPVNSNTRMYKTGDIARYWQDGTIEFLGREDFQVKIRGFRVEIGEVEAAIRQLPNVKDVVCSTWVDSSNHKSLVAYIVPTASHAFDPRAIKDTLAARLQEFMVPTYVVALAALPLSPNGKLDRKALPSPRVKSIRSAQRKPQTPAERILVEIWQGLLEREYVDVGDNFFDIGGHSLLVVMLIAEIAQRFGVSLPLTHILQYPTIEKLAATLSSGNKTSRFLGPTVVDLKVGGPSNFFLIHDGNGETLLYRTFAKLMPHSFTMRGISPRHMHRIPLVDATIETMAKAYVAEVRRIQPKGPYSLGGLSAGGVIAYEMAVQLERASEEINLLVMFDALQPRAPPRPYVTIHRRWQVIHDVYDALFAPAVAVSRALRFCAALTTAFHKAAKATRYEATMAWQKSSRTLRFWLMRAVLLTRQNWPAFVPALSVRQIYMVARERYQPGTLHVGNVIVVKAMIGDDASLQQTADPLLGWERVVKGSIKLIEIEAGHTSMLQSPHVELVADRICACLVTARHPAQQENEEDPRPKLPLQRITSPL
jgi:amino acid adenylation domain-containing protein